MKIAKTFSVIVFLNFLCILLVYQRTDIIKSGYFIEEQENLLEKLSDKRDLLKYHIEGSTSLSNISELLLSSEESFELPSQGRIVIVSSDINSQQSLSQKTDLGFFAKALSLFEREAQAESLTK